MPQFRFMVTPDTSPALIHNLVITLRSVQRVFQFDVHPEVVPMPQPANPKHRAEDIEQIALEIARSRYHGEVPIVVTACDIDDGGFASFDETAAVISVLHWNRPAFSQFPVQRFLLMTIADILMSRLVHTPVHVASRGCIGDRCEEETEVNVGLAQCDYCNDCRRLISNALRGGKINPRELAAVYRILDSAAERRRVFVLMPFASPFDAVHATLKRIAGQRGWDCSRGDDIHHTRDVLSVIWEEIERCNLVIADLTGRNANVFYELGYAHAIDRDTILLTQDRRELPFDLRQFNVIEYDPTTRGRRSLTAALRPFLER